MIEVKGLRKRFGGTLAVNGLSFTVKQGEILGFLGPNGAGKTTTIRILTGFFPPHEGTALIGGHDVVEDTMAVRRLVGYLPENVPLYTDMRVEEYLRFVGRAKGLAKAEAKSEAERVIKAVDIVERRGQLIRQLSKGYRQRVGMAQALVSDPPVLILDEPSIGLDPGQIVEIRSLIKGFAGHKTVMLSSHILPEVEATCDRVVIINRGHLAAEVDLAEGRSERAGRLRLVVGGPSDQVAAALRGVDAVSEVEPLGPAAGHAEATAFSLLTSGGQDAVAELARAVVQGGWQLLELAPAATRLEDIFLRVIRQESTAREVAA